ncbi:hypothetical protein EYR03_08775 [Xanthomonas oryzae pv. oryzae]|uniref:hypothetical protein n=1 Tax=Xanthomonas oryzae TaxID=347 RepID=UPI001036B555|nr:hypothetical protein [Xanthomonas oryzae]QBI15724.1 hypothetical protein EYR03_08775 [Xanthomonas oryzae pv. oryzae]
MCALFRFSLQAGFALHAVTLCLFSGQPSTLCLFGCKDGFFACSDLSFASLDLGQAFGFQSGALGFLGSSFLARNALLLGFPVGKRLAHLIAQRIQRVARLLAGCVNLASLLLEVSDQGLSCLIDGCL